MHEGLVELAFGAQRIGKACFGAQRIGRKIKLSFGEVNLCFYNCTMHFPARLTG